MRKISGGISACSLGKVMGRVCARYFLLAVLYALLRALNTVYFLLTVDLRSGRLC